MAMSQHSQLGDDHILWHRDTCETASWEISTHCGVNLPLYRRCLASTQYNCDSLRDEALSPILINTDSGGISCIQSD